MAAGEERDIGQLLLLLLHVGNYLCTNSLTSVVVIVSEISVLIIVVWTEVVIPIAPIIVIVVIAAAVKTISIGTCVHSESTESVV